MSIKRKIEYTPLLTATACRDRTEQTTAAISRRNRPRTRTATLCRLPMNPNGDSRIGKTGTDRRKPDKQKPPRVSIPAEASSCLIQGVLIK